MSITTVAVTHKEYPVSRDPMYSGLMAGAALMKDVPDGYLRDDTGDNISVRNRTYCELTGLYWAWKNLEDDHIGLCHYRRYFASLKSSRHLWVSGKALQRRKPAGTEDGTFRADVLSLAEAETLLKYTDVIVPAQRHYLIETNYSHYAHAHHAADLDTARAVIEAEYPEYLEAYDRRMAMRSGHRFNMLIMKRDLLDRYCGWLFDILFRMEEQLDISEYTERDRRVFGYVGERLLDVWLDTNGISYTEVPYVMTEREDLPAKAAGLAARKIRAIAENAASGRRKDREE